MPLLRRPILTAKRIVTFWIIGFAVSLVIQTVFQASFAKTTLWGPNRGWQNEIAIWNFGMILVLAPFLKDEQRCRKAAIGLCLMSLLFFLNHAWAAFNTVGTPFTGNIVGAAANGFAVVSCLVLWLFKRR